MQAQGPNGKNLYPLISRAEAKALGQTWYFTGKSCKHGHISKRFVDGGCAECKCSARKSWHDKNPDKVTVYSRKASRSHYKKLKQEFPWAFMLYNTKARAKKKGIDFNLDREWAKQRWTGFCELTGIAFICHETGPSLYGPSIDRIDNTKGYTKDNCRFVLFAVNSMKQSGTDEDCITIAKALVEKHNV